MERMMSCGYPFLFLDTQYRMHPTILSFPNYHFYGNNIKNGENVQLYNRPYYNHHLFGPFSFINIEGREEVLADGKHSYFNMDEVHAVTTLVSLLRRLFFYFPLPSKDKQSVEFLLKYA
jgi:superfamily I DNA and/or RNA helicase